MLNLKIKISNRIMKIKYNIKNMRNTKLNNVQSNHNLLSKFYFYRIQYFQHHYTSTSKYIWKKFWIEKKNILIFSDKIFQSSLVWYIILYFFFSNLKKMYSIVIKDKKIPDKIKWSFKKNHSFIPKNAYYWDKKKYIA